MTADGAKAEAANRAHWDEVAPIHLRSYGIEGLLKGVSRIDDIQRREFYPVKGKDLIHLQCHIGTDTVSLALDGAKVTGVDFSSKSIEIARELAARVGVEVDFIVANVLNLKTVVSKKYDIVYTSKGVLCWISDIDRWAETISFLLRAGGIFYIMETHPVLLMYDDKKGEDLRIKYPYFHRDQPIHFDDDSPDYADASYVAINKTYEWSWSLSDVVNALTRQGLTIELLKEYDRLFHAALPGMNKKDDDWWYLPGYEGMVPLMFTLRARKGS